MAGEPLTIVIADDHRITRHGLRALLSVESDMVVIGETGAGSEAIEMTERMKPDILILDLMLPDINGLEVTWQLKERASQTRILILSMHTDEALVVESLKKGAMGYVLKETSPD